MNPDRHTGRYILRLLIIFTLTFAGSLHWGLNSYVIEPYGLVLWPPTGIALALLFLWGLELFPAIVVGLLFAHILGGSPIIVAVTDTLGHTFEAVIGAWVLRTYIAFEPSFVRLKDAVGFVGVALATPVIAATIGTMGLVAGEVISWNAFQATWAMWWVGDAFDALIITPLILVWMRRLKIPWTPMKLAEGVLMFVLLVAACGLAFLVPAPPFDIRFPMLFIFVPFLWIVLRADPRAVTLAIFITATLIITGTVLGRGTFVINPLPDRLILAQLFGAMVAIVFLLFSAALEERKRINDSLAGHTDELESALRKVRSLDRAKSDFIATLAHELRNPLAPILNTLDLFTISEPNRAEVPQMLSMMRGNVQTMKRLLDDLLDIARLTRKGFALRKEPADVALVAKRAVRNAKHFADERAQTLVVTLAGEPLWAEADPVRMEQVIVNLVSNASRYTQPGGTISFSSGKDGNEIFLTVSDNGMGIKPESQEHIFEPFWQARGPELGDGTPGLGMGLAIVKKIVELHGGRISVKSEVGRGSTFTVHLPATDQSRLPMRKSVVSREQDLRAGGLRILVVDDNVEAAHSMKKLLEAMGNIVSVAFTGSAVPDMVAKTGVQVVFLDIGLPDMSGYDVARRIRERAMQTLLVAITGYGQAEDKAHAKAAGFDYHLTKPVGLSDIRPILASARPLNNS